MNVGSKKETSGSSVTAATPAELEALKEGTGKSGSAVQNFKEQFQERIDRNGGVYEALWAEREHLLLGLAVGMLQGTVGVGGGVLVTTYMSIMSDMQVHRICATVRRVPELAM